MAIKATVTYVMPEADAFVNNSSKNGWIYDNTLLSDIHISVITKPLEDIVTTSDAHAVHPALSKNDAIAAILDTFVRVVAYNREFTDVFTMDDASLIDKDYYGNKGNVAFMLDIIGLEQDKLLADSYTIGDLVGMLYHKYTTELTTLSDAVNYDVGKILEELATLTDAPSVSIQQPKVDSAAISDISDVYPTLNKTEVVSVGDVYSRVLAKHLSDAIALDDAALVDKDYIGTKGNVATVSDVIGLSTEPTISDSVGFSDVLEQAWAYSRSFEDYIVLTDVENNPVGSQILNTSMFNPGNSQFQLYRGNDQVDTFGISDTAAITPVKNFTDTLSILASAFSDTDNYSLDKGVFDPIGCTDVFTYTGIFFYTRDFDDSLSVLEVLGSHFYKLLEESSDIINISDTINVRRVTGGVMNMIPLNRISLN